MSAHRRPAIPYSEAPRGTCRWCGEAIFHADGPRAGELDRRRRWHPACLEAYEATDPREARRIVRKRDRGICAACGLDTYALRRELRGRGMNRKLRARGFVPRRSLWELDHLVPLIDGGGHGLDNLQTLCTPCHKQKSADEARERAARPAPEPEPEPDGDEAVSTPPPAPGAGAPAPPREGRPGRALDLDALLERATRVNERAVETLADLALRR